MPEPLTIGALAVSGLTWVVSEAGGVVGGLLGTVASDAVKGFGTGIRNRIAGWQGVPENEHLATAVRRAQMHALERSVREWRETLTPQWTPLPAETKRFCDVAIGFCATMLGRCVDLQVKLNAEVGGPLAATLNGLLGEAVPGGPAADRAAALAAYAEDVVLAELREALPGIAVPAAFERHLRAGDGGQRARFLALFGHYIADEIKNNAPFRAIFTQGQLATIEGLAFDATEMLDRIEKRFGAGLARIEAGIGRIETAQAEGTQRLAQGIAELKAMLAAREGVDPELLRPIFDHLGHQGLSLAEIRDRAEEAVAAILARARQAMAPTNDGADIDATIGASRERLAGLDTGGALALLDDKLAEEEAARRQRMLPLLRERAAIQRLTYDHAGAKATLRRIADLDPDAVWDWIALGDLHVTTGALAEARSAFRSALDAATRLDPGGRDVSAANNRLGNVLLAQGDRAGALAAYRATHAILERLAAADPGNAWWQRDLSVSHNKLGDVLVAQGDRAGALAAYRASLAIREGLAAADPGNAWWQRDLSVSHNKLGDVLVAQGDRAGALAAYRAGLAIAEWLAAADPGNAEWQRDLSVSHNKLGDVLVAEGDRAGALAAYRASLAIAERLAAADPGNAKWQRDLSVSHNKLGDVLVAQGDRAGALAAYRASLAIRERLAAADPGNAAWQRDLSVSHERLGDVLVAQGDRAGALAAYRAGLAIAERLAAADPGNAGWQRDLSVSHEKLGNVLMAQGDRAGALAAYKADLAIAERLAAADPGNAEWQRDLIVSCVKLSEAEPDRARYWLTRALGIARALAESGRLAPVDARIPGAIEQRLRQLGD